MITKIRKQMKQLTAESSNLSKLLSDMSSLVTGVCALCFIILFGIIFVLNNENAKLKSEIAELKQTQKIEYDSMKEDLEGQITSLQTELENQKTEYEKLAKISVDLDTQNKELVDKINEQNEELEKYEARAELFDQYEYAIIREDGTRTDITYEEIDTLESLAKERDMGDDAVDLVMAIAMTESDGIEDAKNPESTATGFGGLLADTAKYIYETELDSPEGTYIHSTMAKNGELNLQMSLCYVDYLAERNGRNPVKTVNSYRGLKDSEYIAKINGYLKNVNKNLKWLSI